MQYIDLDFINLSPQQVDDLHGLSLRIAFALHFDGYKWFIGEDNELVLAPCGPPANYVFNKRAFHEIGDLRFVIKDIPAYNSKLKYPHKFFSKMKKEFKKVYLKFLKEKCNNDELAMIHSLADVRCRCLLKAVLEVGDRKITEKKNYYYPSIYDQWRVKNEEEKPKKPKTSPSQRKNGSHIHKSYSK